MNEIYTHSERVIEVGTDWVELLKRQAAASPHRRSRLCLHRSPDDAIQEMVIVLCQDTLFQPHKHTTKSESFHIIEGRLYILVFDDEGTVIRAIHLAPPGSHQSFCYRMCIPTWHAIVPVTPFVVFHEITQGPFRKEEALFPDWAPSDLPELKAFLANRLSEARRKGLVLREQPPA